MLATQLLKQNVLFYKSMLLTVVITQENLKKFKKRRKYAN